MQLVLENVRPLTHAELTHIRRQATVRGPVAAAHHKRVCRPPHPRTGPSATPPLGLLSRRGFCQTLTAGLLLPTVTPLSGCDEYGNPDFVMISQLIEAGIVLTKLAFDLAEDITGRLILRNASDQPYPFEVLIDLLELAGDVADTGRATGLVQPKTRVQLRWDEYRAQRRGSHLMNAQLSRAEFDSDTFQVV